MASQFLKLTPMVNWLIYIYACKSKVLTGKEVSVIVGALIMMRIVNHYHRIVIREGIGGLNERK